MPREWMEAIESLLAIRDERPLQLAGVGNPIRRDDSVGLYIASKLRKVRSPQPVSGFKILSPTATPESMFAKLNLKYGNALIFDAVECNQMPGSIIVVDLNDTQYGFFATHNIPLRIIPTLKSPESTVSLLGIEPESTEIGEDLTSTVKSSADIVVEAIRERLETS